MVPHKGQQAHQNATRDLGRRLLKKSLWPQHYQAKTRTWDYKQQIVKEETVSIMLPHEVLGCMVKRAPQQDFYQKEGMDTNSLRHLESVEGMVGKRLVGLGLWGDGAPCNWDRTESIEVYSWNLPGQAGAWSRLRVPIIGISKKSVASRSTHDDILTVVAWSLGQLLAGVHPKTRHDGSPWSASDNWRAKLSSKPLGIHGLLVEIRGDWKFYKETFQFPGWNTKSGICWRCTCRPNSLREVSSAAHWRQERLNHWDLIGRMLENQVPLSPLMGAPYVNSSIFAIDWLHAVDLGVAADFLGGLFATLIHGSLPGASLKARCAHLWSLIQEFYKTQQVEDRLQGLLPSMLQKPNGSAKLRCSAAQCRALVPFAQAAATTWLGQGTVESTIKAAASHLAECYQALKMDFGPHANHLEAHSRQFAGLVVALEQEHPMRFRVKPKMHLFLELCISGSKPSLSWTYRDEDFGGTAAQLSRRRGGLLSAKATSHNFCCASG